MKTTCLDLETVTRLLEHLRTSFPSLEFVLNNKDETIEVCTGSQECIMFAIDRYLQFHSFVQNGVRTVTFNQMLLLGDIWRSILSFFEPTETITKEGVETVCYTKVTSSPNKLLRWSLRYKYGAENLFGIVPFWAGGELVTERPSGNVKLERS